MPGSPDPGSGSAVRNAGPECGSGMRVRIRCPGPGPGPGPDSRRDVACRRSPGAGRLGLASPLTRTFRADGQLTHPMVDAMRPPSRKLTLKRLSDQGRRADLLLVLFGLLHWCSVIHGSSQGMLPSGASGQDAFPGGELSCGVALGRHDRAADRLVPQGGTASLDGLSSAAGTRRPSGDERRLGTT